MLMKGSFLTKKAPQRENFTRFLQFLELIAILMKKPDCFEVSFSAGNLAC